MYLSYDDLLTGINTESLNVITRNRDNADQAIREAVAEVRSYLCVRYDIDSELQKSGNDRDPMVFRMVRDIALYRCYAISNPASMPEMRRRNYDDAIVLLKEQETELCDRCGRIRLKSNREVK